MSQQITCSKCGAMIGPEAPGGLCVGCLLALGLKEDAGSELADQEAPEETLETADLPDGFDHYRPIEKIGEGGCGVVYRAEQFHPVRRQVAIKVIKLGMDTRSVVTRFEAERQALAMMDHPGIAKVFDGGATRQGRPYFVMELVSGEPITDYCRRRALPLEDTLRLFIELCQAVQHAHRKGIIHRDLKPSNVLVIEGGGVPHPKVIDFGVARATSRQRLTDETIYTAFDQFVGTPAYMSPEQAGLSEDDIDTRSDVYSLGVLLYELLAGEPPFDPQRLRRAALDEICRIIRDEEPVRPSARLTTLSRGGTSDAAQTADADRARFARRIRGDLDWIVMKALEKQRSRRYETANDFALDIERHLKNEPVSARSPSGIYRFGKLVRRNKLAVIATLTVMVVLAAGALVSTWRFLLEQQARQRAVAAEQKAQAQAVRSEQVAQVLKDVLAGAGPSVALGRDTTLLREILDRTSERISNGLKIDGQVEAELRETIGRAYYDLRELDKAEAMYRAALSLRRSQFADTNPAVAEVMMELAVVLNTRAGAKDLTDAESLFRPVLLARRQQLGETHLQVAKMLQLLASNLRSQRKLPEAEALYREALAIRVQLQGDDSPALVSGFESMALLLTDDPQRLEEAESFIRRAAAIQDHSGDRESPARIESLAVRGIVFRACGKPAEAVAAMREAITLRRKIYGEQNETLPPQLSTLAISLSDLGKSEEAEQAIREAIALQRKYRGDEHPHLANFLLGTLMKILLDQQKWAEAEAVGRELVPLLKKVSPHRLLARLDALHLLGIAHIRQMHWEEAEHALRESVELCEQPLESGRLSSPIRCARLRRMLGEALLRQGKYAEAETLLLAAHAALQGNHGRLARGDSEKSMVQLAELCDITGRPGEANAWRQKLAEFQKTRGEKTGEAPAPQP